MSPQTQFHKARLFLPVAMLLFLNSLLRIASAQEVKTFNEITEALNPIETIVNHDGVRRSIDLNIQFAFGSSELLPAANRQVEALGLAMESPKLKHCGITLIGHTDAKGDEQANLALSQSRAEAVRQALVNSFDIVAEKLVAVGKGESELIAKLGPGDARHRRVEIILTDIEMCKEATKKANSSKSPAKQENKIDW